MTLYAVNLIDLGDEDEVLMGLLRPVLRWDKRVEAERGVGGDGWVLQCEEERAQAIVELVRLKKKPWELRCYCKGPGERRWRRI